MGSYTFKWEGEANEVIITGIWDDWARNNKMDKKDGYFEKTVQIPEQFLNKEKIHYKFVVDGDWVAKSSARSEYLGSNYDNYLLPEEIDRSSTAAISSVTPASTTAQMAGEIPKEPRLQEEKDLPGAFPETPAPAEDSKDKSLGADPIAAPTESKDTVSPSVGDSQASTKDDPSSTFSVNPLPATSGAGNPISLAPGEKIPALSDITNNKLDTAVEDDTTLSKGGNSEQAFSVAPIPATSGAGNPISLAPGEKIPPLSDITSNKLDSAIEDDTTLSKVGNSDQTVSVAPIPATSDKSLGNPIHLAPGEKVPDSSQITSNTIQSTVSDDNKGDTLTENKTSASNGALFGVPPVIPTSSLPLGGDKSKDTDVLSGLTTQSAGPDSSTAVLAGQVPKEPRAESSTKADAPTIQSVAPTSTTAALAGSVPKVSEDVPAIVSESQKEAKVEPEASASAEAVADKTAVETELLKEVKKEPAVAESGQTPVPAKVSETTPAAPSAPAVLPDPVKESIAIADASPEAATNQAAVAEKTAVEEELKKTVPKENSTGEPAPTATAATSATAPTATSETTTAAPTGSLAKPTTAAVATGVVAPASKTIPEPARATPADSRDVSPMSKTPTAGHPKPGQQTEPTVTTGVSTTTAPKVSEATSSTPKKAEATPSTPKKTDTAPTTPKKQTDGGESTAGDNKSSKKRNRLSKIYHKIVDKVSK